ncbi:MAG: restriction endonuclease subunit S [Cyanobacteria bacterium J06621_3]
MSFPKYEVYKDSGVEWLGEVPEHWDIKRLKYLLNNRGLVRGPFGSDLRKDSFVDEGIKVYEQKNAIYQNYKLGKSFISNEKFAEMRRFQVKGGDYIMSCSGTIGKVYRIPDKAPIGIINQALLIIRLGKALLSEFADWIFVADFFSNQILDNSKGGAMKNLVGMDIFTSISFQIPSQEEQKQIAQFLDYETARIDALIVEQQRLIELLKEKRQAVISHAVTKGLDPTVPMKDSGVEWIGEVPEQWAVGALRWYSTIQGGIAKGKDYKEQETVTLPYLRVANVQNGFLDLSEVKEIAVLESEIERYMLKTGDVLMNEGGDNDKLGRGAVWDGQISPCLHQNHVFAIRPNRQLQDAWLATFTQSEQARTYFYLNSKQSTNLASISASNVMSLSLPLPCLKDQQQILEYLEKDRIKYEKLVDVATSTVELLQERRSALISAAVTGKIDVRDWQPPADS